MNSVLLLAALLIADAWTCPMDPQVKQTEPGVCPKCGMRLVERRGGELVISAERRQLINLRTIKAEERELMKTLRVAALLAADETKLVEVTAESAGVIEQILGNAAGQRVKKGELLFSILASDGKKSAVRATATGHISWRIAFAGTQVTPKMKLATISEHATLWAWAEIYEPDVASIELGQTGTLSTPAQPGRSFELRVTQIAPVLNPDTHTMKVRLDVPNSDYQLKPGMSAIVELAVSLGKKLAIPEAAVIRTGAENVVYVAKDEGRFEARKVELGARANRWYEVIAGIEAGDELAATATFLLDAERKLQGL